MRIVVLMGVAALLSACNGAGLLAARHSRHRFVSDGREEKDLPSLADMPWWELYRDEALSRN